MNHMNHISHMNYISMNHIFSSCGNLINLGIRNMKANSNELIDSLQVSLVELFLSELRGTVFI